MERPNVVLIVTDQERAPMHWPDDPHFLDELMPATAGLRRTGLTFAGAITNSCMCTPARATLFTGLYPPRHGAPLTLTHGVLPDPRNFPGVVGTLGQVLLRGEVPRGQVARSFARSALRRGAGPGHQPPLSPEVPNLAQMLRDAGYTVVLKGKWHLTRSVGEDWGPADSERFEREFGFGGWEPPDPGEATKPHLFGGGHADLDSAFASQAAEFLRSGPPEPFALVVSLVNPHDVIAYPSTFDEGGYRRDEWRDLGVGLPETVDEDLTGKPTPHALMRLGQAAYIGALRGREARLDYVNFYAHLHRLVDGHIGRVLDALGALRERTLVIRTSDHGEMGLAHGGLRQKMFNAYEETVRVPLVFSHPGLFPSAVETDAPAGLVDLVPTLASLCGATLPGAGVEGVDLTPVLAHHAANGDLPVEPAASVRDHSLFVYDDHRAGTAFDNVIPQPNHIRAVRERRFKYAVYVDPEGRAARQYELYDLAEDPNERENLVDHRTGRPRSRRHADDVERLAAASETVPGTVS